MSVVVGRSNRVHVPKAPAGASSAGASKNLGKLANPGSKMAKETFQLAPGKTLTFRFEGNQIWGIYGLKVAPANGAKTAFKKLQNSNGSLGGNSLYEWKVTVPANAKKDKVVKLITEPAFQARNDPKWAFEFKIKVA